MDYFSTDVKADSVQFSATEKCLHVSKKRKETYDAIQHISDKNNYKVCQVQQPTSPEELWQMLRKQVYLRLSIRLESSDKMLTVLNPMRITAIYSRFFMLNNTYFHYIQMHMPCLFICGLSVAQCRLYSRKENVSWADS